MHAPIRLNRSGFPDWVGKRAGRLVRDDPRPLASGDADADTFRRIMSPLYLGETIKITGLGRHREADDLLLANVDLDGQRLLDVGASDGSTSVELISRLPAFDSYVIGDLFLSVQTATTSRHVLFYDHAGICALVAGRRLIAWPSLSPTVRALYRFVLGAADRRESPRRELLLLNPETRALLARDPRVTARVHDVFTVWPEKRVDVIKVANLLRRLYFSDDDIVRGLRAVHASLADDGHLLIVDNPRIAGVTVRAGLYRRTSRGFRLIAQTPHPAEETGSPS